MSKSAVHTKKYLLPVLFLALLVLHGVDAWFDFLPEPVVNERRVPAEKPELDPTFLDPFPRDYEQYYNDHFNWRNYFIKASSYLNYHVFNKSSLPDKVLIGKNGWFFKAGAQLDIYRGKLRFTPDQLAEIGHELTYRQQIVEQNGGKYYLVIAPQKHKIYPELLPDNITIVNPADATNQVLHYLKKNTSVNALDLTPFLLREKAKRDSILYLRTDHHWNFIAGLTAAKAIVDHLRNDFPTIPPVDVEAYDIAYDTYGGLVLAEMLGLEEELNEYFPRLEPKFTPVARDTVREYPPPNGFPFPKDYVVAKYTGKTELPSLFMVRESFASSLVDVLGERFEYSFFLFDNWKHEFNRDIYEIEKGDIFIQMIWEGLLFELLEDPPEGTGWK